MLNRLASILIGLVVVALIGLVAAHEGSLLPPWEQVKANCYKPVHHDQYESRNNGERATKYLAVLKSSQSDQAGSNGNTEQRHVEFDCMVAEYTKILARFTLWLVVATTVLGVGTFVAALAAKAAADHIPVVERAYMFGGPTNIGLTADLSQARLGLTVDNPGRTPAILKRACIEFSDTAPVGKKPRYSERMESRDLDLVINSSNGLAWSDIRNKIILPIEIFSDTTGPHYCWGHFEYLDIFGQRHMSRFCALLRPKDGKFEPFGGEAWNAWT